MTVAAGTVSDARNRRGTDCQREFLGALPVLGALPFLGAAVVAFACVGWYLDWYRIKSAPSDPGHQQLNIDLNRSKISADVHKGVQKGEETIQDLIEKSKNEKPTTHELVGPVKPPQK